MLAYQGMARADELRMLFAARALQGLSAGNIAVAQAYIVDITMPANRARGMGFLGTALGLWFIVGPAIGGRRLAAAKGEVKTWSLLSKNSGPRGSILSGTQHPGERLLEYFREPMPIMAPREICQAMAVPE
jgi:hypothetical protein